MDSEQLRHLVKMDDYTFDCLMSQYGQSVWNYAYFLTRQRQLADDVTQDTFIKAYLHIANFRGECTIQSWLFKIARNIALNYNRTAFLKRVTLVDKVERTGYIRSAEDDFLDRDTTNEIWRNVLELSTPYREVIILDAKYDMSLAEMAQLLGISVGTVKSRLHRARAKLSARLKEDACHETL